MERADIVVSGPVRHLQHPGVLIPAVTRVQVAVVSALHAVDVLHPPLDAHEANILLVKTTAANATMIVVIETVMLVLEALMIATAR